MPDTEDPVSCPAMPDSERVPPRAMLEEGSFFLQKPFTPVALTEMVRVVLDSEEPTTGPTDS